MNTDFVVQQVVLGRIIDCVDTLCADKIYDCQFNIETCTCLIKLPVIQRGSFCARNAVAYTFITGGADVSLVRRMADMYGFLFLSMRLRFFLFNHLMFQIFNNTQGTVLTAVEARMFCTVSTTLFKIVMRH